MILMSLKFCLLLMSSIYIDISKHVCLVGVCIFYSVCCLITECSDLFGCVEKFVLDHQKMTKFYFCVRYALRSKLTHILWISSSRLMILLSTDLPMDFSVCSLVTIFWEWNKEWVEHEMWDDTNLNKKTNNVYSMIFFTENYTCGMNGWMIGRRPPYIYFCTLCLLLVIIIIMLVVLKWTHLWFVCRLRSLLAPRLTRQTSPVIAFIGLHSLNPCWIYCAVRSFLFQ